MTIVNCFRRNWWDASAAVSIATGWSDPVPGRELHPLKSSAFSRRTFATTNRARTLFRCSFSVPSGFTSRTVHLGESLQRSFVSVDHPLTARLPRSALGFFVFRHFGFQVALHQPGEVLHDILQGW